MRRLIPTLVNLAEYHDTRELCVGIARNHWVEYVYSYSVLSQYRYPLAMECNQRPTGPFFLFYPAPGLSG